MPTPIPTENEKEGTTKAINEKQRRRSVKKVTSNKQLRVLCEQVGRKRLLAP